MSDLEGDDMALFKRFAKQPRPTARVQGRMEKDARRPTSKRVMGSGRTGQLNLRCRPDWHDHVKRMAREDRLSMIEVIEIGVELYERERESLR